MKPILGYLVLIALCAPLRSALPEARTLVYKTAGTLAIRADVRAPSSPEPRPVVVFLHGGSLINGRRESVEKWTPAGTLLAAGITVVSIDYRLAPETKLPEIVADVEDAFRWVREQGPVLFGADPARVAAAGSSAGGYLALLAGHRVRPALRAVTAEMGYGDLLGDWLLQASRHPPHYADSQLGEVEAWRQVAGPPIANAADRSGDGSAFNDFIRRSAQWPKAVSGWDPRTEAARFTPYLPVRHLSPDFPPTFLLHGEADSDVPFAEARRLAAGLLEHGVEHRLVGLPGVEHGFRGADRAVLAAAHADLAAFLRRHLEPVSSASRGRSAAPSPLP